MIYILCFTVSDESMGEKSIAEFLDEIEKALDIKVKSQFLTLREQDARMKDEKKFVSYLSGTLDLIKQLKTLGFPFVMKGFMTIHILQPDCSLDLGDWFYQYAVTSPGSLSMKFFGLKDHLEPTRTSPNDLKRAFTVEYIKQLRLSAKSEKLFKRCVVASIPDMGNEKIETEKILTSSEETKTLIKAPLIRQDSSKSLQYIDILSAKYGVIYDLVTDNMVMTHMELAFNMAPQPGDKKFMAFASKLDYQEDYVKEHFQSDSHSSPFKALMCDLHGNHPEMPTKDVLNALSAVGRSDVLFQMQRYQMLSSTRSLDLPEMMPDRISQSVRERSASEHNVFNPQMSRCRSLTDVPQRELKEQEDVREKQSQVKAIYKEIEKKNIKVSQTPKLSKKPSHLTEDVKKSTDDTRGNVTNVSNTTEQGNSGLELNLSYPMTAEAVGKSLVSVQTNGGGTSESSERRETDLRPQLNLSYPMTAEAVGKSSNTVQRIGSGTSESSQKPDTDLQNGVNSNNSYPPTRNFVLQSAARFEDLGGEQSQPGSSIEGLKPLSDIINPSYPPTKDAVMGPFGNSKLRPSLMPKPLPKVQNPAYPGTKSAISQSASHAGGSKVQPPMLKKLNTGTKSNPTSGFEECKVGHPMLNLKELHIATKSNPAQSMEPESDIRNKQLHDSYPHYINKDAIKKEEDKESINRKLTFPGTSPTFENDYSNTSETENTYSNGESMEANCPSYGNVGTNHGTNGEDNSLRYENQMAISDHKASIKNKYQADPNKEAEFENGVYSEPQNDSDEDEDYTQISDYDYAHPEA